MTLTQNRIVQLVVTGVVFYLSPTWALVNTGNAHVPPVKWHQAKTSNKTLQAVVTESQKLEVGAWQTNVIKTVLNELKSISATSNPLPEASIEYVFVLSARSTYKGELADPKGNPDHEDDRNRMNLGISYAREVTASKLGKASALLTAQDLALHGPTIIYNGVPMQNTQLREALIAGTLHLYYPRQKFLIAELPPDQMHTLGQFVSFKHLVHIERTSVAIVTHAYHFPRVSRLLHSEASSYPFGDGVKIIPVLVDRQYEAPGAFKDLMGELERIPKYIQKKDLYPEPLSSTVDRAA